MDATQIRQTFADPKDRGEAEYQLFVEMVAQLADIEEALTAIRWKLPG